MGARALPAGGVLTETSGETGVGTSPPRGHWAGSGEERRWPAQDLASSGPGLSSSQTGRMRSTCYTPTARLKPFPSAPKTLT